MKTGVYTKTLYWGDVIPSIAYHETEGYLSTSRVSRMRMRRTVTNVNFFGNRPQLELSEGLTPGISPDKPVLAQLIGGCPLSDLPQMLRLGIEVRCTPAIHGACH